MRSLVPAIVAAQLTGVALGAVLCFGVPSSASSTQDEPTQYAQWMKRPCPYEDSANCFWDAGNMGDGQGHSFFAHKYDDGDLCVAYTQHAYARTHDWCLSNIEYDARSTALMDMDGDGGGAETS